MRAFDGFLKGVNLGGWLSQYREGTKEHFDTFITKSDLVRIANAGFDHVRVPVDYEVIETDDEEDIEEGYEYITTCIDWCRELGLKMMIDLHKAYGYSFDPLDKDMDREAFFHDKGLQERFYRLWDRISSRYSSYSDMLSFELLNEVVSPNVVNEWNDIAREASLVIRKNAPDSYIVIGGVCYNNVTSVPLLGAPIDDKIVYNFHCYEPLVFTHQRAYWVDNMPKDLVMNYPDSLEIYREKSQLLAQDLADAINEGEITELGPSLFDTLFKPAVEMAEKMNVPLYCGEYGVIDLAPADSAKRWFADIHSIFNKYGIGHAAWSYKEMDYGHTVGRVFFDMD
ncbi:MAG: cellulase family glycosylhydrolase [Lachnospiraceae bacterium]|nr:cellulase family glycosylhydrolase [Lachnospiraceae bacterium]